MLLFIPCKFAAAFHGPSLTPRLDLDFAPNDGCRFFFPTAHSSSLLDRRSNKPMHELSGRNAQVSHGQVSADAL